MLKIVPEINDSYEHVVFKDKYILVNNVAYDYVSEASEFTKGDEDYVVNYMGYLYVR